MTSLTFSAHGTPAAQGSKRHIGGGRMIEQSKKVKPWRAIVEAAARNAARMTGWPGAVDSPVRVRVTYRLARPASHYRTGRNRHLLRAAAPTAPIGHQHGDLDKLQRATFDALTAAAVISDDSRIAEVHARKVWAQEGETTGATIVLETIDGARPW